MTSFTASTLLPLIVVFAIGRSTGYRLPAFQCDPSNRQTVQSWRHPYLVAIVYKGQLIGAGAIISKHHVLTSASTIFFHSAMYDGEIPLPSLNVHADLKGGRWDQPEQVLEVVDPEVETGYAAHTARDIDVNWRIYMSTLEHDLAVLRIKGSFEWCDRVRPIDMIEADDKAKLLGMRVSTIPTWDADGPNNSTKMFAYTGMRVKEAKHCEICTMKRYVVGLDAKAGWCVDKCDGDDQRYLNGSPVVIDEILVGVVAGPMGICSLQSAYVMDVRNHLVMINNIIEQDPDLDTCEVEVEDDDDDDNHNHNDDNEDNKNNSNDDDDDNNSDDNNDDDKNDNKNDDKNDNKNDNKNEDKNDNKNEDKNDDDNNDDDNNDDSNDDNNDDNKYNNKDNNKDNNNDEDNDECRN
ncbi:unnamed protein product [Trichogramma brassicae]|uniref:Peptidase S1 domain-containing protein n=1 Tax=Trichogramma brassicae TaxID=86971 RepID=A0A6H5IA80_9HYME|nr:unnamed protein product [Trichogramma brassicae]